MRRHCGHVPASPGTDADARVASNATRQRAAAQRRGALEQVPQVRRGALPARSGSQSLRLHALRISLSNERLRSHRVDRGRRFHRNRRRGRRGRPAWLVRQEAVPRETQNRSRAQRSLRIGHLRLCNDRRLSGRARRDGFQLSGRHDGPRYGRADCAAARGVATPKRTLRHLRRLGRRPHGRGHAGPHADGKDHRRRRRASWRPATFLWSS